MKKAMTTNIDAEQNEEDMACLLRIKALVIKEGFTGGPILKVINEQIEYVKQGGML